jgi:hypothetical protein
VLCAHAAVVVSADVGHQCVVLWCAPLTSSALEASTNLGLCCVTPLMVQSVRCYVADALLLQQPGLKVTALSC